jgi:hypothetical protein
MLQAHIAITPFFAVAPPSHHLREASIAGRDEPKRISAVVLPSMRPASPTMTLRR